PYRRRRGGVSVIVPRDEQLGVNLHVRTCSPGYPTEATRLAALRDYEAIDDVVVVAGVARRDGAAVSRGIAIEAGRCEAGKGCRYVERIRAGKADRARVVDSLVRKVCRAREATLRRRER